MTIAAAKSDRPPLSEAEFIAGFHAIAKSATITTSVSSLMHEGKLTRRSVASLGAQSLLLSSRIHHQDAAILARQ